MQLDFHADSRAFLEAAGHLLRGDPVPATVVATVAQRQVETGDPGGPDDWWLVVRDATGAVVGAGMRTAPFAPRPAYLLAMPDQAAVLLARTLHERGEHVAALNGALPAARVCADELARLQGGTVHTVERVRLFVLGDPVTPAPVPGVLDRAGEEELGLVEAWFAAFLDDADAQAGRVPGSGPHAMPSGDVLRERFRSGGIYLWRDPDGRPVHLTAHGPISLGVARIGPVYTPPDQRGRGWASAAVHAVAVGLVAKGARVCLFTDQDNPISNALYPRLGFVPVHDQANLSIG